MTSLVKIARKRNKGVVQGCDVYISKSCQAAGWKLLPSKWAPPKGMQKQPNFLEAYREHLHTTGLIEDIYELAYQQLGCFCKRREQCHGAVLCELVEEWVAKSDVASRKRKRVAISVDRKPMWKARKKKAPIAIRAKSIEKAESIEKVPERFKSLLDEAMAVIAQYNTIPIREVMHEPVVKWVAWTERPFSCEAKLKSASIPEDITIVCDNGVTVIYRAKPPRTDLPVIEADISIGPDDCKLLNLDVAKRWARFRKVLTMKRLPSYDHINITTVQKVEPMCLPFVCIVSKLINNKRTKRFLMVIESPAKSTKKEEAIKVELNSELFPAIRQRVIRKGDRLLVEDWSVTLVGGRKRRLIILHKVWKLTA